MSGVPKKPPQSTPEYNPRFRRDVGPPSSNGGLSPGTPKSIEECAYQEPYVDAQRVAEQLSLTRREVLKLTRARKLPAHPVDPSAIRKIYRYKLSEIDETLSRSGTAEEPLGFTMPSRHNDHRQPRDRRGKVNGQREW